MGSQFNLPQCATFIKRIREGIWPPANSSGHCGQQSRLAIRANDTPWILGLGIARKLRVVIPIVQDL
jgi:hypothetical protein